MSSISPVYVFVPTTESREVSAEGSTSVPAYETAQFWCPVGALIDFKIDEGGGMKSFEEAQGKLRELGLELNMRVMHVRKENSVGALISYGVKVDSYDIAKELPSFAALYMFSGFHELAPA